MPYIARIVIAFKIPGIERERTQDVLLEQEEPPSSEDIDAHLPGAIAYLHTYSSSDAWLQNYQNITYTWILEAIFYVEPLA